MASDFYDLNINLNGVFRNADEVQRQLKQFSAPINVKIDANIDALQNLARPRKATVTAVIENRNDLDKLEHQIAKISGINKISLQLDTPGIDRAKQSLNTVNTEILGITKNLIGIGRSSAISNLGSSFKNASAEVIKFRSEAAKAEADLIKFNQINSL